MILSRVTAPAELPVSLAEAKAHCAVLHTDDDALIQSLISAATSRMDGASGILRRSLVTQTWTAKGMSFSDRLPLPPIQSVDSVSYWSDGVSVTVPVEDYRLAGDCLEAVSAWPTTDIRADAVTVTYTAGYGDAADVPDDLKAAISMLVRFLYDNRGNDASDIPPAIGMLVENYRVKTL